MLINNSFLTDNKNASNDEFILGTLQVEIFLAGQGTVGSYIWNGISKKTETNI